VTLPPFSCSTFNINILGKEFELGLELDSAEVRGILLYNNQEWGRFASFFPHPPSKSDLTVVYSAG
jgi:hypothetical protein